MFPDWVKKLIDGFKFDHKDWEVFPVIMHIHNIEDLDNEFVFQPGIVCFRSPDGDQYEYDYMMGSFPELQDFLIRLSSIMRKNPSIGG